jgi:hypothetical protein
MQPIIILTPPARNFLTDPELKDDFIQSILEVLSGEPITTTNHHVKEILIHIQPRTIKRLTDFPPPPQVASKYEQARLNQLARGEVPANGLEHAYKKLIFEDILMLDQAYLETLYEDCTQRLINVKPGDYKRFLTYLQRVLRKAATVL